MFRFYTPNITSSNLLSEEESQHCAKVLRMSSGDIAEAFDGNGSIYKIKIVNPHHKKTSFEIIETETFSEKKSKIHIAIAPTKNIDRFEWFVEKATEIGVDTITPLLCNHSERKILKEERIEKIVVSASKQSLRAHKPLLNSLTDFSTFIKNEAATKRYIAYCGDFEKVELYDTIETDEDIVILIGPEGDFSPKEVELAFANNYKPVTLGKARLRTETAGIVATHIAVLKRLQ